MRRIKLRKAATATPRRARAASSAVHSIPIGDGLALYHEGSPRLHILNPSGRLLWRVLAAGQSVDAAARTLARRSDAPFARVLEDCRETAALIERLSQEATGAGKPASAPPQIPAQSHARAAAGWTCRIAGQVFSLHAEPELLAQMANVVGHLRSGSAAAAGRRFELLSRAQGFALTVDGREYSRSRTLSGLQYRLMQAVAAFALAAPGRLAWLHAGAVLHGARCLVFPARGGSGKTTLVAGLMQRGHAVLADDVVGVADRSLDILPLPLPLSVKQGSWPVVAARFPELLSSPVLAIGPKRVRLLPPSAPPGGAWEQGHRAAALIEPLYRPGAPVQLQPCNPWEMARSVFDARSAICLPDAARVRRLVRWIGALPAYRLVYDDLDDALDRLDRLRPP